MFFTFATEFKAFYSDTSSRTSAMTIPQLIQETNFRSFIYCEVIEGETAEM